MQSYDVVVVGGGPSGLAVAQGCARYGKSVLVLDKEDVLGGCHRVRRVDDGLFTEHGPRIYNTNFRTLGRFLREMGHDLSDVFAKADVYIPKGFREITGVDRTSLICTLIWTVFFPEYGRDVSMSEYMDARGFSSSSRDAVDRECLSTDGADARRYSVLEYFDLVHQHAFYHVMEPKQPNDTGLFAYWKSFLEAKGVSFALGSEVTGIRSVVVPGGGGGGVVEYRKDGHKIAAVAENVVLAVPPESLSDLIEPQESEVRDAFGPHESLDEWAHHTSYHDYVSFTMHYDADVSAHVGKRKSKELTPWSVLAVPLSEFMTFVDLDQPPSDHLRRTVLSCIAMRLDAPSPYTGRSANDAKGDKDEVLAEAVRQVLEANPGLPSPSRALLSPGTFWNAKGHWDDTDTAFMRVPGAMFLPQRSPTARWLWSVGCHNGNQKYQFTSIEAAVSNSAALLHGWFGRRARRDYPIVAPFELRDAVRIALAVLVVIVVLIVAYAWTSQRRGRPSSRRSRR